MHDALRRPSVQRARDASGQLLTKPLDTPAQQGAQTLIHMFARIPSTLPVDGMLSPFGAQPMMPSVGGFSRGGRYR
jgi:hypothetical protein